MAGSIESRLQLLEDTAKTLSDLQNRVAKLEDQTKTLTDRTTRTEGLWQTTQSLPDRLDKLDASVATLTDHADEDRKSIGEKQEAQASALEELSKKIEDMESKVG